MFASCSTATFSDPLCAARPGSGVLLIFAAHAAAQPAAAAPWTEIVVQSSAIGPRTIRVATPSEYARGTDRYAVLVMSTPRIVRCAARHRAGILSQSQRRRRAGDDRRWNRNGQDRIHDMTPTPTGSSVAAFKTAGGASAFADFVLRDVIPSVRARYRTLPTNDPRRSLGGRAVRWTWPRRGRAASTASSHGPRDLVQRRRASPALRRCHCALAGGHPGLRRIRRARVGHRYRDDRVLATARGGEIIDGNVRGPPLPEDSHALVPLAALPDGLRFVFAPLSLQRLPIAKLAEGVDAAAVMAALATSEAQYAEAARSLHLPEALPEIALERASRFARNTVKNDDLAVRILARNVALYPGSARAGARLADGHAAKGDVAAAIVQLRQRLRWIDRRRPSFLPMRGRSCAS